MSIRIMEEEKGNDEKKKQNKRQRDCYSQALTSDENKYEFAAVMSTISTIVLVSIFSV